MCFKEIFAVKSAKFQFNFSHYLHVDAASRTTYKNEGFQGETQLLKPVNLDLEIQRNLSSNWYHSIPDIEITAHLKPMSVSSAARNDSFGVNVLLLLEVY